MILEASTFLIPHSGSQFHLHPHGAVVLRKGPGSLVASHGRSDCLRKGRGRRKQLWWTRIMYQGFHSLICILSPVLGMRRLKDKVISINDDYANTNKNDNY